MKVKTATEDHLFYTSYSSQYGGRMSFNCHIFALKWLSDDVVLCFINFAFTHLQHGTCLSVLTYEPPGAMFHYEQEVKVGLKDFNWLI